MRSAWINIDFLSAPLLVILMSIEHARRCEYLMSLNQCNLNMHGILFNNIATFGLLNGFINTIEFESGWRNNIGFLYISNGIWFDTALSKHSKHAIIYFGSVAHFLLSLLTRCNCASLKGLSPHL